ncbi:DUF4376 domain-containing protein [Aeromonas caviae]|uniref:DUF4376 domain-containing protein n=1 Tax=Aeromonas caviae TaxID=648 RepID=UPI002AB375F3|nr:DUF4376 domain-containing protein [Aeromonas caviae]MDY7784273.1 DUF4376 domain-containing protein [Aeromonas caviae]
MSIDWQKAITAEQRAAQQALAEYETWKVERQERVDAIVVEVDGLAFDGNEISTRRMADVIAAADDLANATEWTLADNRVVVVTVQQLKQALRLSTEARTAIWNADRPAPPGEITSHR